MRICSHLLSKFLTEKFIFCVLICASKQTENYSEEENNLFLEKLCCFFIHIFRKSLCNLQIFYRSVFRCKFLGPFVFYLFEIKFFFAGRKCVNLAVIFNNGREETCGIFTKSPTLLLHKISVRSRTLIAVNFTFLYSM